MKWRVGDDEHLLPIVPQMPQKVIQKLVLLQVLVDSLLVQQLVQHRVNAADGVLQKKRR